MKLVLDFRQKVNKTKGGRFFTKKEIGNGIVCSVAHGMQKNMGENVNWNMWLDTI